MKLKIKNKKKLFHTIFFSLTVSSLVVFCLFQIISYKIIKDVTLLEQSNKIDAIKIFLKIQFQLLY
jgi:hypothetical protein